MRKGGMLFQIYKQKIKEEKTNKKLELKMTWMKEEGSGRKQKRRGCKERAQEEWCDDDEEMEDEKTQEKLQAVNRKMVEEFKEEAQSDPE